MKPSNILHSLRALRGQAARAGAGMALALAALAGAETALAQAPAAIDITVPYAAGGPSDALARRLARHMAPTLGQAVVFNNRPGANGLTGLRGFIEGAAGRPAYVLVGAPTFLSAAVNEPALLDRVRPVALVGMAPLVVVRAPGSAGLEQAVVQPARAKGALEMAIATPGSISHLCAAQLAQAIGVPLKPVVYRGAAPMLVDLMGGQAEAGCLELNYAVPHWRSGRLSVVAATGDEASDVLPGVPPLAQFRLDGVTRGLWYVMMAAADAPPAQTAAFAAALQKALAAEATDPSRRETGFQVIPPEAATEAAAIGFIQREYARLKPHLALFKQ